MSAPRNASTWLSDFSYYDASYYKSALNQGNIWKLDYHLARVHNTPSYCNHLLQDLHGQIETTQLDKMPEIISFHSRNPINDSAFKIMLNDIMVSIELAKLTGNDKSLVRKGLAWYLISTALLSEIELEDLDPEVLEYVIILQDTMDTKNPQVIFQNLVDLCGTRFSAEKSRTLIKTIVSSLV